jgi:hypothetical protein
VRGAASADGKSEVKPIGAIDEKAGLIKVIDLTLQSEQDLGIDEVHDASILGPFAEPALRISCRGMWCQTKRRKHRNL